MRRSRMRAQRSVRAPLEYQILSMSPYFFIEADTYTIDGGTSKINGWTDKVRPGTGIRATTAAHAFVQTASAAVQCPVPAFEPTMGGRFAATFNADAYYQSNAPASAWRAFFDGTGCELFVVLNRSTTTGTQYIHATTSAGNAVGGTQLFQTTGGTNHYYRIGNATAGIADRDMGAYTTGPSYMDCYYSESESPKTAAYDKTALSSSGATTGAPATGVDPSYAMTLGGTSAGTAKMAAKWVMSLGFTRVLTAGERQRVRSYITAKYAIT